MTNEFSNPPQEAKRLQEENEQNTAISRRTFLKALIYTMTALTGFFSLDNLLVDGALTNTFSRFLSDPEYRQKVEQIISSGEGVEELKELMYENMSWNYTDQCRLDVETQYREKVLDRGFSSYSVRELSEEGRLTGKLVLIGELPLGGGRVIRNENVEQPKATLHELQERYGDFWLLPSSHVEVIGTENGYTHPFTFPTQLETDGEIIEIMAPFVLGFSKKW